MITRDEIRSIPELHKSIERDKEQLRFLREKATCLPSLNDRERVQTSPSNNVNSYSDEAADLNREIRKKELELTELQGRAKEIIDTISNPLAKKVMKFRYLKCLSWEGVAELAGYSERRVQQIEWEIVRDL